MLDWQEPLMLAITPERFAQWEENGKVYSKLEPLVQSTLAIAAIESVEPLCALGKSKDPTGLRELLSWRSHVMENIFSHCSKDVVELIAKCNAFGRVLFLSDVEVREAEETARAEALFDAAHDRGSLWKKRQTYAERFATAMCDRNGVETCHPSLLEDEIARKKAEVDVLLGREPRDVTEDAKEKVDKMCSLWMRFDPKAPEKYSKYLKAYENSIVADACSKAHAIAAMGEMYVNLKVAEARQEAKALLSDSVAFIDQKVAEAEQLAEAVLAKAKALNPSIPVFQLQRYQDWIHFNFFFQFFFQFFFFNFFSIFFQFFFQFFPP
jgi:hypothetical protein